MENTKMKKKNKNNKKLKEINWNRIISLSAAGNFISNQLTNELDVMNDNFRSRRFGTK